MSIINTIKELFGVKPVDIAELNKYVTHPTITESSIEKITNPLEDIIISPEYKSVESMINTGYPVIFVTGNAGTGKSTLIQYLRIVVKKRMVVVAPTGVAALNVGGATIHSFFKLPPKIHEDDDIKLVYDRRLYQKLELLIIDEVSMVRCDLMDSIDKFLRKNRNTDLPFGGVQLLLIGDLFQIAPVTPNQEMSVLQRKGYSSPYFFSSFSLQKSSFIPVELSFVYRQADDTFISLLNNLRIGENIEPSLKYINKCCFPNKEGSSELTLTCTNNRADEINMTELNKLPDKEFSFIGEFEGNFSYKEDTLPSPLNLKLKKGAHVMFTKNDVSKKWINGTLGIVRNIGEKSISVELIGRNNGQIYDVRKVTWETYKYSYDNQKEQIIANKVASYTQYPLMLAWAVTIHKSQGKTLENVLIELGDGAFATGQVYVALSRCKSINGITLKRPIRRTDIKCDPLIKRFYYAMHEMKNLKKSDGNQQ